MDYIAHFSLIIDCVKKLNNRQVFHSSKNDFYSQDD